MRPLLLIYGGGAAGDSAAPFPFTQVFLAGPYVGNRGGRGGGAFIAGEDGESRKEKHGTRFNHDQNVIPNSPCQCEEASV